MAGHINLWNTLFATTQLAIAAGLLFRRTTKLALASSIVWGVMVWWLGEGLGGMLAGPISPLMGLPGAVIIYALIALLIWPREPDAAGSDSVASASPLGWRWPKLIWLTFWAAFAFEALRPVNRSPSALHDMVAGMESGEPAWVKSIDRAGASALAHHGTQVSIALAILFAFIAVAVFIPAVTRAGIVTAIALAGLIWVFGEDFGALATGQATDPNSGPLLALFALCFWPVIPHPRHAGDADSAVRMADHGASLAHRRQLVAAIGTLLLVAVAVFSIGSHKKGLTPAVPSVVKSGHVTVGNLTLTNGYIPQPAAPGFAAAYLTVTNSGSLADSILRVSTNVTSDVTAMQETSTATVGTTTDLSEPTIPAHGSIKLTPGHGVLMLQNPDRHLKSGDKVRLTVTFAHAGMVTLNIPVVAGVGLSDGSSGMPRMPGMG